MEIDRISKIILDNMNEQVYVRDLDMNILYINPAAERLTGWSLKQALGRKCWEVFGDKDRICREVCPANRAISEKLPIFHYEGKLMDHNGEVKEMGVSISPLYERKDIIGAVVVMDDITQLREVEQTNGKNVIALEQKIEKRKRVEETLLESRGKYRFLTESMADVVWTLDRDLNTTYISPSVERVLGKN